MMPSQNTQPDPTDLALIEAVGADPMNVLLGSVSHSARDRATAVVTWAAAYEWRDGSAELPLERYNEILRSTGYVKLGISRAMPR